MSAVTIKDKQYSPETVAFWLKTGKSVLQMLSDKNILSQFHKRYFRLAHSENEFGLHFEDELARRLVLTTIDILSGLQFEFDDPPTYVITETLVDPEENDEFVKDDFFGGLVNALDFLIYFKIFSQIHRLKRKTNDGWEELDPIEMANMF